jgi:transcriptional regulator with PAS, ATPase and Fis domain
MGLFEHANGGTLFLDEIGDMPLSTQAKLLRVLQNQEVLRVGSLTPQKVDVRVVAATNKDLRQQIAERRFREDLYFRLSMVEIHTPPLAQRIGDLPLLTRHFIKKFSQQYNKNITGLTQRAQILLGRHTWPGNVRELENVIGHGCMMTMANMIDVADLPPLAPHAASAAAAVSLPQPESVTDPANASLEEHEKKLVMDALNQAAGNQSKAARQLRIGRDALRYKMKKFGLL